MYWEQKNKKYENDYLVEITPNVKIMAEKFLEKVFQRKRKRNILAIDSYGNLFFTLNEEPKVLYGLEIEKRRKNLNSKKAFTFVFTSSIFTYNPKAFKEFINPVQEEIEDVEACEKIAGKKNKEQILVKEFNYYANEIENVILQEPSQFYREIIEQTNFDRQKLENIYTLESEDIHNENPFFVEKLYTSIIDDVEELYDFINLRVLIVQYKYLNKKIKRLRNLSSLTLPNINDNALIKYITTLPYLVNLDLSYSDGITTNLHGLHTRTELKYLTITKGKNLNIETIFECENLQTLSISQTHLENLQLLQKLNIYFLSLAECTNVDFENICHITSLQELHITYCDIQNIEFIEEAKEKLKNLKILNLSHNRIKEVPKSLFALPNLSSVDLSYNDIQLLPNGTEDVIHKNMQNLETLNLEKNSLMTVPTNLWKLKKLKSLRLKKNPFESLPSDLNKFSKNIIDLEFSNIALYDKDAKHMLDKNSKGKYLFENDMGLKLMVIQKLMYEDEILFPKFDVHEFAQKNKLDLEKIEEETQRSVIPQAWEYFKNLPIEKVLLFDITELYFDGSQEIYMQIAPNGQPNWDDIAVKNLEDIKYLVNLKKTNAMNFTKAQIKTLKNKGIQVTLE